MSTLMKLLIPEVVEFSELIVDGDRVWMANYNGTNFFYVGEIGMWTPSQGTASDRTLSIVQAAWEQYLLRIVTE